MRGMDASLIALQLVVKENELQDLEDKATKVVDNVFEQEYGSHEEPKPLEGEVWESTWMSLAVMGMEMQAAQKLIDNQQKIALGKYKHRMSTHKCRVGQGGTILSQVELHQEYNTITAALAPALPTAGLVRRFRHQGKKWYRDQLQNYKNEVEGLRVKLEKDAQYLSVPVPALGEDPSLRDLVNHVGPLATAVTPLMTAVYTTQRNEMVQKVGQTRLVVETDFLPFGEHPTKYEPLRRALTELMTAMVELEERVAARHGIELPVTEGRGPWEWHHYLAHHQVLMQVSVVLGDLLKTG